MNKSPAVRLRVSIDTPVAAQSTSVEPPVAAEASAAVHNGFICRSLKPRRVPRSRNLAGYLDIVEGISLAADDLAGFVSFPSDD